MPDPFELPRMLRPVVPLWVVRGLPVSAEVSYANLLLSPLGMPSGRRRFARRCARLYPGLAAIIGALNDLSEPRARLRRVNPVRINRRTLDVIKFPARKMRPVHFPIFALRIRSQNECAFPCANQ